MPKKKKAKKSKIQKKSILKKTKGKTKVSLKIPEKKSTNLGPDEKPEIKKIKKQPTEKRIYSLKDFVVLRVLDIRQSPLKNKKATN